MNKRNKSLLIGMIIGDGHVVSRKHPKHNYTQNTLIIKHSIKQIEYLNHKAKLLHSIFGGKKPHVNIIDNSGYEGCILYKTDRYFKVLRKLLYPDGKKKISRDVLKYLTPEGIALWYMDDGSLSAKKRNGKIHAYDLTINTYISKEENEEIIEYFRDIWDIKFTVVKSKSSYRIRCGTREARKFIKIIEPYIVESMRYKINIRK